MGISKQIISPIVKYKNVFDFNKLKSSIIQACEIEEIEDSEAVNSILQNRKLLYEIIKCK